MGASLGLAGMTGCVRLPLEPIVPYVRQPEGVIPGRPMYYATASTLGGYASPLLVESHLGRPTKIEGNDLHPASLGGTDIFAQASILGLYDPDRSQTVMSMGDVRSWQAFLGAIRGPLSAQKALQGRRHPHSHAHNFFAHARRPAAQFPEDLSASQVARLRAGQSRQRPRRREASLRQPVETRYDFSKADVIVSLDADFLSAGFPGNTRYIRDFAAPQSRRTSERLATESADHLAT
jgi:hypothetical protein